MSIPEKCYGIGTGPNWFRFVIDVITLRAMRHTVAQTCVILASRVILVSRVILASCVILVSAIDSHSLDGPVARVLASPT